MQQMESNQTWMSFHLTVKLYYDAQEKLLGLMVLAMPSSVSTSVLPLETNVGSNTFVRF